MNKAQRDIRRKKRVLEHRMYGAAGSSSGAAVVRLLMGG